MKKLFAVFTIAIFLFIGIAAFADEEKKKEEIPYPVIENAMPCFVQDEIGYYPLIGAVTNVEFQNFIEACKIFERYKVSKIVIFLNSPGGGAFAGLGFVQLMQEQKAKGMIIEVRCYGIAASAASIIMSAGSKGHRYIAPGSFVMIHELLSYKFFAVESVSDTEKEAQIKRMIQNEIIGLLAHNTKLSKEELIKKCKEESWATALTAIEWGFADKLIK